MAKQNHKFREFLLKTGSARLALSTKYFGNMYPPYQKSYSTLATFSGAWGTGYGLDEPSTRDPNVWDSNRIGGLLEDLREQIREEDGNM